MSTDDEILEAFLAESRENLAELDVDLVDLEERPTDPELLGRVFRTIHTVKGTCGFLGFTRLETLTHAGESVLGELRDGRLSLDAGVVDVLLRLVDAVRAVLDHIEATKVESGEAHDELIGDLDALRSGGHRPTPVAGAAPARPAVPREAGAGPPLTASETTVRVDVAVLDKLMDLVGELVLARSRLTDVEGGEDNGELAVQHRHLRSVTNELEASVMEARLQPIGTVLSRFHRIVRDLASSLERRVRLELEGEEVGVDKAVNEALSDPLMHLVRNAIDHAIEPPEERVAAGKSPEGTVRIHAEHQSGMVHVEVIDDGRGIDPDDLVRRAVSTGVLTADAAESLTTRDAFDLMFHPGLSTKTEVTNVSGRGVGLDVVRANVHGLGGSVEVRSEPGAGSTFRLNVPLTLAIMPVLMVGCGDQQYALPEAHVREVVRIEASELAGAIDVVDGTRLHRRRGRLIPLVELRELFELDSPESDDVTLVVVEVDDLRFGVIVDEVGDTSDVVVKPLSRIARGVGLFSAVTLRSDGQPSLILDLARIAAASGVQPDDHAATTEAEGVSDAEVAKLLLGRARDGGRVAVRVDAVRRLERFPADAVERTGEIDVVHHGDALLPLLGAGEVLPEGRTASGSVAAIPDDLVRAVLCDSSVGVVAIVVDTIDDIVPEPPVPAQPASRAGVEARVVIDGHVVELLDVEAMVAAAGLELPRG